MTEATAAAAATETIEKPATTTPPADKAGGSDSGAKPTLLNGGGQEDGQQTVPANWPDDWRERFAGKDEDALKTLKRFQSVDGLWKSYKSMRQQISSGEYKKNTPFPADGTPEQQAEWRAEMGIPEAPDKYDTNVEEGFVWGEADKPLLDDYTTFAHANNLTPDQVKTNLNWYRQMQQKMVDARDQQDAEFRKQSEDALRAEWGPEYRPNLNAVKNWLDTMPKGVGEALLGGRTADGRLIGDHPEILAALAQTARELNPAATILPAGKANITDIGSRLSEIETMMKDRRSDYYRGPNADKLQQEYRDLLVAKSRMDTRAA